MNEQRNNTLDVIKTVCTFMVVFIHAGENSSLATYTKAICTCAVPFFFLVSGYYLSLNISAGKTEYIHRQLKKIGVLFITSNIIYAVCVSVLMLLFHDDLSGFWKRALSGGSMIDFLLFNNSPFAYHLWYIGALLYAFVFYSLMSVRKKQPGKSIGYLPFLLILAIVTGVYSDLFFKRSFPIYISRNFISIGIPSIAIGYMLHSAINKYHRLRKYALLSVLVLAVSVMLERFILHHSGILSTGSIFIATLPLAVSIFVFAATDERGYSASIMKALADIGRRDSANIYIYHLLFLYISDHMITGKNAVYLHTKALLIFIMTLAFSRGLQFVQNSFFKRKRPLTNR